MTHYFIFLLIISPVIFSAVCSAEQSEPQPEVYQEILIVPSQQEMLVLDRYHRAFDADDMTANAMYILRNTRMLELLQARKELKRFIGGTERARKLAMDKNLTFQFRQRTCNIYLENCNPQSMNIDAEIISDKGIASLVRSPLYELHKAIFDLYTKEVTYDEDKRIKLVFGLIHLSAILSKLDRHIRWFTHDVWQYKKIMPLGECADQDAAYINYQHVGRRNCNAKLRAESKKIVTTLAWYRSVLIDRYRILITRVRYDSRSDYLYKLIYRQLEKIGFPSLKQKLKPAPNYHRLSWPADFEQRLHEALANLSQRRDFRTVFPAINNYIDLAMLKALEANTAMLHRLGDEIHFDASKSKSLRQLASDADLWQRARQQFGYLSPVIDFAQIEADFRTQATTVEQRHNRLRKISEYSAAGLGGVGLLASFNLPPLLKKKPLFAALVWLVGGSLLTWSELNALLRNRNPTTAVVDGYFGNSMTRYSWEEVRAAQKLRDGDVLRFAFSALLLGADLFFINRLTNVFGKLHARVLGERSPLAVSLRQRTERITYRLQRSVGGKARVFKAVLLGEHLEYYSRNPHIDRALRFLSREWRLPRRVLDKTLFKLISKEKLSAAIRKRTQHSDFVTYLTSSTLVSLTHLTIAEWRLYGDDFKYNLDRIAVDYISSIFFSFMLSWINFGETKTIFAGLFKKTRQNQMHLTLRQRAGIFKTQFYRTLGVGFIGTFPAVSIIELNQLRTGKKTTREALRNIMGMSVFGAAYISTLSNLRVQFLREVSRALEGRKSLMFVLHNFNSLFGQWVWVKSKDASGAYKKGAVLGKEEYYLVKGVTASSERSYLFDFMNKNQHPAVSLQLPEQLEGHYR